MKKKVKLLLIGLLAMGTFFSCKKEFTVTIMDGSTTLKEWSGKEGETVTIKAEEVTIPDVAHYEFIGFTVSGDTALKQFPLIATMETVFTVNRIGIDATLKSLSILDEAIAGFSADTLKYSQHLGDDLADYDQLMALKESDILAVGNQSGSTATITMSPTTIGSPNISRNITILVDAEKSGVSKTYEVELTAKDFSATDVRIDKIELINLKGTYSIEPNATLTNYWDITLDSIEDFFISDLRPHIEITPVAASAKPLFLNPFSSKKIENGYIKMQVAFLIDNNGVQKTYGFFFKTIDKRLEYSTKKYAEIEEIVILQEERTNAATENFVDLKETIEIPMYASENDYDDFKTKLTALINQNNTENAIDFFNGHYNINYTNDNEIKKNIEITTPYNQSSFVITVHLYAKKYNSHSEDPYSVQYQFSTEVRKITNAFDPTEDYEGLTFLSLTNRKGCLHSSGTPPLVIKTAYLFNLAKMKTIAGLGQTGMSPTITDYTLYEVGYEGGMSYSVYFIYQNNSNNQYRGLEYKTTVSGTEILLTPETATKPDYQYVAMKGVSIGTLEDQ